jgi:hypothetical protein
MHGNLSKSKNGLFFTIADRDPPAHAKVISAQLMFLDIHVVSLKCKRNLLLCKTRTE